MLRARGGHGRRGRPWLWRSSDGHKLNRRVRPVHDDHLPRWQGRQARGSWTEEFEPCPMLLRRARSERWTARDLRSAFTEHDRSCPPGTSGFRCPTDPARTSATHPCQPTAVPRGEAAHAELAVEVIGGHAVMEATMDSDPGSQAMGPASSPSSPSPSSPSSSPSCWPHGSGCDPRPAPRPPGGRDRGGQPGPAAGE
jgi:hypothetical protein